MNVVLRKNTMKERFYNFYKSPDQMRRLGARGGRISARRRAGRAPRGITPVPIPRPATEWATTAQDIALLDARFPWLRGAEKRESPEGRLRFLRAVSHGA
jgi:hypothetical protein